MKPSALVDSSAILALLNRRDYWHNACIAAFEAVGAPLLCSEAVVTEVFHLLGKVPGGREGFWVLLRSRAIRVARIEEAEYPKLEKLMLKYADRWMDFADATLVHLAEREELDLILTLDVKDFSTYRIRGRKPFRVMPEPR
jgi:uncharacterized protein